MILRLVKMKFRSDNVEDFIVLFEARKARIQQVDGCEEVKLWRSTSDTTIFFTQSIWRDEACLEAYRNSSFFIETWTLTKALFDAAPEAWSLVMQA